MLNKVILMGRLTADPEFRQTTGGTPCCRFRIAINRPTSKEGNQQTDFINIVCWRQKAEFVSHYFAKGDMIMIEGQMRNNDYTDNNGTKHYSFEVLAENVSFCESKKYDNDAQAAPANQYAAPPQQYPQNAAYPQQYQAPQMNQQYQPQYQAPPQFGSVPAPNGNPYHPN